LGQGWSVWEKDSTVFWQTIWIQVCCVGTRVLCLIQDCCVSEKMVYLGQRCCIWGQGYCVWDKAGTVWGKLFGDKVLCLGQSYCKVGTRLVLFGTSCLDTMLLFLGQAAVLGTR